MDRNRTLPCETINGLRPVDERTCATVRPRRPAIAPRVPPKVPAERGIPLRVSSQNKIPPGIATTDWDCALASEKGGRKYVFVSDGKVNKIADQDLGLPEVGHAGHAVQLTGEMKGDTISVSVVTVDAKK